MVAESREVCRSDGQAQGVLTSQVAKTSTKVLESVFARVEFSEQTRPSASGAVFSHQDACMGHSVLVLQRDR